ncbi:hypothetical protein D3C71_2049660 [compost metagenome]
MASAGSAAWSHSDSEVSWNTRTASVSQPNWRVISVIGISFITSTITIRKPDSRPVRSSGRCSRRSVCQGVRPSEAQASSWLRVMRCMALSLA